MKRLKPYSPSSIKSFFESKKYWYPSFFFKLSGDSNIYSRRGQYCEDVLCGVDCPELYALEDTEVEEVQKWTDWASEELATRKTLSALNKLVDVSKCRLQETLSADTPSGFPIKGIADIAHTDSSGPIVDIKSCNKLPKLTRGGKLYKEKWSMIRQQAVYWDAKNRQSDMYLFFVCHDGSHLAYKIPDEDLNEAIKEVHSDVDHIENFIEQDELDIAQACFYDNRKGPFITPEYEKKVNNFYRLRYGLV